MTHFAPSPLFQIRLEENTLTMRGSQTESVGCVLRGQLVLALTKSTKFKEIKLIFQGKSKISWSDNYEERILYRHDWTFLPAKKNYHVLKPDNYYWDFELILPGTLPETIEKCQYGSVKYMLKAVAKRHALAFNLQTQRQVTLLRSLPPWDFLNTSVITGTWTDKIAYEFSTNSKVFVFGDMISIMTNLRSIREDLKVRKVKLMLKEYATYTVGAYKKMDSKTLAVVEEGCFPQNVNSWNDTIKLSIPDHSSYCHCDSESNAIRISHKLKFYITFMDQNNNNRIYELRAFLPIIITSVSLDSDIMALPAYNENHESYSDKACFKDDPYSSSLSLSSFSEPLHEIEELSKLPSYRSIASLIPAPLADPLLPPTYDGKI